MTQKMFSTWQYQSLEIICRQYIMSSAGEYPKDNYTRAYRPKIDPYLIGDMKDHFLFPHCKFSSFFQKSPSVVKSVVTRGVAHIANVISPDMSFRGQSIIHRSCGGINPQIPFTVVWAILHSPVP